MSLARHRPFHFRKLSLSWCPKSASQHYFLFKSACVIEVSPKSPKRTIIEKTSLRSEKVINTDPFFGINVLRTKRKRVFWAPNFFRRTASIFACKCWVFSFKWFRLSVFLLFRLFISSLRKRSGRHRNKQIHLLMFVKGDVMLVRRAQRKIQFVWRGLTKTTKHKTACMLEAEPSCLLLMLFLIIFK